MTFMHSEDWQILLQVAIALFFGGLIGWEREHSGKWAGLRTHMLVCAAATLLVRMGFLLTDYAQQRLPTSQLSHDPLRILEAVIAGVAFLGAGTVFRDPEQARMRGLTTAASLLTVVSIGVSSALERYGLALGMTLLVLFVLRVMNWIEDRAFPADKAN